MATPEPTPTAATFALTPLPPSKVEVDLNPSDAKRAGMRGRPTTNPITAAAIMIPGAEFKN